MSNTRIAKEGQPMRQERFASHSDFERGLMANLVAKRAKLISAKAERELIWFLQMLSHSDGLDKVAADLIRDFPDELIPETLRKIGMENGQKYSGEQVKSIRMEFPDGENRFPLKGELTDYEAISLPSVPEPWEDRLDHHRSQAIEKHERARKAADKKPTTYETKDFLSVCNEGARELPEYLAKICLDPSTRLVTGPWYFPRLREALASYRAQWTKLKDGGFVTGVGRQINEALDYALETGCLAFVDGIARIGKSHAAKQWCNLHPGIARYIQVPSENDSIGFFRAIAKSLGVSINLNSKAHELRQRIEDAVAESDLMLVFDEAHYLWPNSQYREAMPTRVNWIMTALVNMGVPVALVATPQFFRHQDRLERRSGWTSEQFVGRIGHYEKLPDVIEDDDLAKVAASIIGHDERKAIRLLVCYAQVSVKYLAAIECASRRAKYLANKDGRALAEFKDIKRAIEQSQIPSDNGLAAAMEHRPQSRTPAAPARKPVASPVPVPLASSRNLSRDLDIPARTIESVLA